MFGPADAALIEHVAQSPAVVGYALAEHEVCVEAALRNSALLHVLVAEHLALCQRVVKGGEAERGDVGVGGGVLGRPPGVDVLRAEFVVGHEAHRNRECRHRVLGDGRGVAGRLTIGEHVTDVGLVDHLGAAVMFAGRQADVDVDAEGLGDFGAQVLAECAAGDAAGDLAEDEAERDHVVALRGAGLPPRFGLWRCVRTPRPSQGSPLASGGCAARSRRSDGSSPWRR